MRAIHLLVVPLTVGLLLGGCSSGSGLQNTGGSTSTKSGGGTGQGSAGSEAGGASPNSTLASGGSQAPGGNTGSAVSTSGGAPAASSTTAGGRAGGKDGSSSPVGGTSRTGGAGTTARTATGTGGGTSTTGGTTSTAGATGASPSTGGSSSGGAVSAGSGTSRDAGVGDGGIAASGYCEGNTAKLTYQGQTVTPGVTDFQSNIAMDCCNGYGVNLHSTPTLGFDVAIELVLELNVFTPGEYDVGGPTSMKARALVFKSSEPITSVGSANALGKLRVFGVDGSAGFAEFGICLEVTDAVSGLGGTKLYVPRVIIGSYQLDKRFQIFLLKDTTVGAGTASTQPLDSLILADSPLLDLTRIAYVEKATTKMGFTPGQQVGTSLRTRLGNPLDMPFVVVADGIRIYLGTFTSLVSSMSPTGPFVSVEEITVDSLTLHAPLSGTDPRSDDRIIKALSERGKLVP